MDNGTLISVQDRHLNLDSDEFLLLSLEDAKEVVIAVKCFYRLVAKPLDTGVRMEGVQDCLPLTRRFWTYPQTGSVKSPPTHNMMHYTSAKHLFHAT